MDLLLKHSASLEAVTEVGACDPVGGAKEQEVLKDC